MLDDRKTQQGKPNLSLDASSNPFLLLAEKLQRKFRVKHQPAPSGCDTTELVQGLKHSGLGACSGGKDHG
jgi:hypothetical protein